MVLVTALRESGAKTVIHFAGLKAVSESVQQPLSYDDNNVVGSLHLLEAMRICGVKTLVFSSSATVYGNPQRLRLTEDHPLSATNPYGQASGHGTPTVVQSLHKEEARKDSLVAELAQLQALTSTLSSNERQITKRLRDVLSNHPALLGRHVPLARQMLRTLLDGHILCEPIEEDHRPGYRFTATGTFGRLLTGTSVNGPGSSERKRNTSGLRTLSGGVNGG